MSVKNVLVEVFNGEKVYPTDNISMEGLGDMFKKLFSSLGFGKKKDPGITEETTTDEIQKLVSETYLNDKWLSAKTLVTEDINVHDFSFYFALEGKSEFDILDNLEVGQARLAKLRDSWFQIMKPFLALIEKIDDNLKIAVVANKDKPDVVIKLLEDAEAAVIKACPLKRFPRGIDLLGNVVLTVPPGSDSVIEVVKSKPVGPIMVKPLNKEQIIKAAKMMIVLIDVHNFGNYYHKLIGGPDGTSHSDGHEMNDIFDAMPEFGTESDNYYELTYHQNIDSMYLDALQHYESIHAFKMARGLEDYIRRSIVM